MHARTCKFSGHFKTPPFIADELFRDLSPRSEDNLRLIRRRKTFSKNDTVFAAGDLPKCIYILKSGQARVTVLNGINNLTDLRPVKTREILGLNEVMTNSFCQMNIETVTPCIFDCLRRQDFLRFLETNPAVCFRLLNVLGTDLQKSHEQFSMTAF